MERTIPHIRPGLYRIVRYTSPSRGGVQMRFLVQLLLAFVTGLVLGYVLLSLWDMIAPHRSALDPFDARYHYR